MATHSSIVAWGIPGTKKPGGLPSMGSDRQTRLKRLCSSSRVIIKYSESELGEFVGSCWLVYKFMVCT